MNLLDAQLVAGVKFDIAAFCREHDVSRRTVQRHAARIAAEGQWQPRSRRPHLSPNQTSGDLEAWIRKLREDLAPDNGADYIRDKLIAMHTETAPGWAVPARSTINRVLGRLGLLVPTPSKRPRSSWKRFSYARPRDCYQIDATTVRLADGIKVVVFEVLDDCTRLLVACHAAPAETANSAIAAFAKAVRDLGAPALVLSDNGMAFASHPKPGSLPSQFAHAVNQHGSRLIHSSPYHPQTCGKVERHHQTLKKWLSTQPAPATLKRLQRLLDTYRDYYNNHRRHSALPARATPHHAWTNAATLGGPTHLPVQTDASVHRCPIEDNGRIHVGRQRISIGRANARAYGPGATVTAVRNGYHVTIYDPDGQPIGHAILNPSRDAVPFTKINKGDTCPGT
jgi:hypothetical protein